MRSICSVTTWKFPPLLLCLGLKKKIKVLSVQIGIQLQLVDLVAFNFVSCASVTCGPDSHKMSENENNDYVWVAFSKGNIAKSASAMNKHTRLSTSHLKRGWVVNN